MAAPSPPQPSDVRGFYPAIDETDYPDQIVTTWIANADPYFDACRWGGYYYQGVSSWVAHMLVTFVPPAGSGSPTASQQAKAGSSAGDVATKKVGDVSITRDSQMLNKQAESPYMSTKYGQMYLWLRNQVDVGSVAV